MVEGELPGAAAAGPAGSTGVVKHDKARYFFVVVPALLVIIFVKEGCLLLFLFLPRYSKGLLFPRSSKTCLFQDVPKFSKIFQNVPKGCFSQHLLRVFSLFTSTVSQSFFFRSFPDFPGVFWDSPWVFHRLSNTLYTGNRWGGQFWFPVLIHTAAASAYIPCAFGWLRLY